MSAKWQRILGWFVAIVILDQLTKVIVDRTMTLHQSIPIIDGFFNLTYVRNTGAAFGILSGAHEALRLPFLIAVSVAAVGFIVVMLRRVRADAVGVITAFALILGGAIGNLIDRILYGEVIDFLDFYYSGYHWPAFNVADSCITIGVALTIFYVIRAKDEDPFAPN